MLLRELRDGAGNLISGSVGEMRQLRELPRISALRFGFPTTARDAPLAPSDSLRDSLEPLGSQMFASAARLRPTAQSDNAVLVSYTERHPLVRALISIA